MTEVDDPVPGWKKDPSGRFVGRYWDGTGWTDQVVTKNRKQTTDPYQALPMHPGTPDPPPARLRSPVQPPPIPNVPSVSAPTSETPGRTWRTWQVLAIAIASLFIGVAAGAGGASNGEDDAPVAATDSQVATTASTLADSRPAATASPPTAVATTVTTQPPIKGWVEVITLSGMSEKRSDNFRLTGAQARLRYKSSAGVFGVYVLKSSDSLEKSGGFTEVSCSAACEDETRLVKSAGEYYLDVKVSRGSWSVTIEELR